MAISVVQVGTEQKVNQTTDNQQTEASLTALADGGWVVTWTSNGQDGSGAGIYQRKYNADGSTLGEDILVNATPDGNQTLPNVTALAGGGWVVTWTSDAQDGSGLGVYQRFFGASGDAGVEAKVNLTTSGNQTNSAAAGLPGGGWVVAWEAPDASGSGIYYRMYDSAGTTSGADIPVNTTTGSTQINVSVTALEVTNPGDPTSGGFVITWQSLNQDGASYGTYQRRYDGTGAAGAEVQVNTTTASDQDSPSVAGLADGGWVVTWRSFAQDGALGGIYQQRYDKSGGAVGGETLVNFTTQGAQSEPVVTALTDGGWVVTWTSNVGSDGSLNGIYQRHFSSDGEAGPQLLVNVTTLNEQTSPAVTATPDGGWIVAWTSQDQDGSGNGIYQRRYTGSGSELSTKQDYASGSALDDVLSAATGTFNANDVLDGGAGVDTIQYNGTLDWTVGASVSNFEALKGGSGDDTLVISAAELGTLTLSIDGSGGTDKLQVTGGGALDLTGKAIANVESIELTSSAGTAVTVNAASKSLALLLKGNASSDDQVTLQGGAFKQAELMQLIQNGINTIIDANGTFVNEAPTNLSLDPSTVAENAAAGTLVSTIKVADPTDGDLHTFALTNDGGGRFEIVGDELRVKSGALLNFEGSASHAITIKVTDAGGNTYSEDFTITLTNLNEAPTDIGLAGTSVAENATNGTQIGTLSATDPDTGDTFKYALVNNAGGRFDIQSGKLVVSNGALLDFEGQASHTIVVEVTDKGGTGLVFQKQFTVNLTNINEKPTDITLSASNAAENAAADTVIGKLAGIDPDAGDVPTLELVDDAGGRFKIVGDELQVADGTKLDFEGGPTSHTVTVRATDPANSGFTVDKNFTIMVTGVNEAPTALDLLGSFVAQQAETGTLVGTPLATDPDAGETDFTYTLLDNADGRFAIQNGKLVVADGSKLDASVATMHTVTIQVADAGGLTFQNDFIINVGEANHAPSDVDLSGDKTIAENAVGGDVVGTLSGIDQDAILGDVIAFSLVDDAGGLFAIVDGELVVADGAVLDFEKNQSHVVEIVASDTSGASITESFTIGVKNVNEAPTDVALSANAVVGKPTTDTVVGTVSGTDPDAGDQLTFTLTDNAGGRFKLGANNQLLVADAALFNGTAGSYDVKVTATDSGGLSREETFTIAVGRAGTEKKPLKLSSDAFHVGKAAADAEDRIVYDKGTGALYYDRDGTGAAAAVKFATLKKGLGLTYHDFFVI